MSLLKMTSPHDLTSSSSLSLILIQSYLFVFELLWTFRIDPSSMVLVKILQSEIDERVFNLLFKCEFDLTGSVTD